MTFSDSTLIPGEANAVRLLPKNTVVARTPVRSSIWRRVTDDVMDDVMVESFVLPPYRVR